jgi:hypothetical protein
LSCAFDLSETAHHHGVRVVELRVRLERDQPEAGRRRREVRVVRVHQAGRQLPHTGGLYEVLELLEVGVGNRDAGVLQHLLGRAEEEHAIAQNRPANRTAELLAAEGNLLGVGLPGEIVLGGEGLVALVHERRSVQQVGARLGHHRQRRAGRSPVRGIELARGELEFLQALRREAHQRAAVMVVAIVGAVNGGNDVRARRSSIRHRSDVLLAPVKRPDSGGARQQRQHPADRARDHRQVLKLRRLNRGGQLRLGHLDQRRLARHGQGFFQPREAQAEIDRERRVDDQRHVPARRRGKARQFRRDGVRPRLEAGHEIQALLVAHGRAHDARVLVRHRDHDSRQGRVGLVENPPVERAGGLRLRRARGHQHCHCDAPHQVADASDRRCRSHCAPLVFPETEKRPRRWWQWDVSAELKQRDAPASLVTRNAWDSYVFGAAGWHVRCRRTILSGRDSPGRTGCRMRASWCRRTTRGRGGRQTPAAPDSRLRTPDSRLRTPGRAPGSGLQA